MATPWGNNSGPVYPLGLFTVTTAGTVILLSANVPLITAWGTAVGGIAGLTTSGQRSTLCANRIICMAPSANTGDVYLVYKGQAAATAGGSSVILSIPKGQVRVLESPQLSNPFQLDQFGVDADTNGDKLYITTVIV